ncbi:hypothetical protein, partial [Kingella kingae]|uniref:hypothetical protein n=1 Tax=Kingella kingae TaxID=504 RepID=UPI0025539F87
NLIAGYYHKPKASCSHQFGWRSVQAWGMVLVTPPRSRFCFVYPVCVSDRVFAISGCLKAVSPNHSD